MQELTKHLDIVSSLVFAGNSADGDTTKDLVHELRLRMISCEREMCKARLEVAQTQVAKAEAEEAVLRVRKACAQKEVEALRNLLDAYEDAELRQNVFYPCKDVFHMSRYQWDVHESYLPSCL